MSTNYNLLISYSNILTKEGKHLSLKEKSVVKKTKDLSKKDKNMNVLVSFLDKEKNSKVREKMIALNAGNKEIKSPYPLFSTKVAGYVEALTLAWLTSLFGIAMLSTSIYIWVK